jgi:hypothetical protein
MVRLVMPQAFFEMSEYGRKLGLWRRVRCESGSSKICGVQCYTTGYLLVGRVDVENAIFGISNPDDFRDCTIEGRLGSVSGLSVEEVPSGGRLCSRPVVLCLGEQSFVLIS